jgi:large subunit ribosomal protein L6
MSRIGKKPISIPTGVTVSVDGDSVGVKGPKGSLTQTVVRHISVTVEDNQVLVHRANDSRMARANHGLIRALLNNMVVGVSVGFEKKLAVKGVGYRVDVRGSKLVLNLGFSHPIEYAIPSDIKVEVDRANNISVTGVDKQRVGQVAAVLRNFRKPDRYKGKGVRYADEHILLKAGKSAGR